MQSHDLHRSDCGSRSSDGCNAGEGQELASLLNICLRECCGELDGTSEWLGNGDDVRAVDEVLLAQDLELGHGGFEECCHKVLVVCRTQRASQ